MPGDPRGNHEMYQVCYETPMFRQLKSEPMLTPDGKQILMVLRDEVYQDTDAHNTVCFVFIRTNDCCVLCVR